MHIQEQEGHLGLMRIQCHCKPGGFKQGCEEGFMIQTKISNGFLPRNTRFKRGQSSHQDVQYSKDLNTSWGTGLSSNRIYGLQTLGTVIKKITV